MITKGTTVRILRDTSFWFNNVGMVTIVESSEGELAYPIVVKFSTPNYAGKYSTNFALDELVILEEPAIEKKPKKSVEKKENEETKSVINEETKKNEETKEEKERVLG